MSERDIYHLTKKELVHELRTYSGAKLSGNKIQLQTQLLAYRARAEVNEDSGAESNTALAASVDDMLLGDAAFTDEASGETKAPMPKATGVGARKSSSVRATMAPLNQGEALKFVFPSPGVKCYELTAQCLMILDATCSVQISKDPDPRLLEQLRPLLTLCKSIKQHTENMTTSSSHHLNVLELRDHVDKDFAVSEWASAEAMARLHPSVKRIIQAFQRPSKVWSAEDTDVTHPGLVQSPISSGSDSESSNNSDESFHISCLHNETLRVQAGIATFMQGWSKTFPEPEVGEWPFDFDPKIERPALRKFIVAALQASGFKHSTAAESENGDDEVIAAEEPTQEQEIDALVKDILEKDDFPLAKGKNNAVVRAIIKEQLYASQTQRKRKSDFRVKTC